MERFASKRDGWLIGILVIALGIALVSLGAGLAQPGHPVGLWGVFGILLAAMAFVIWLWTGTDYLLGEEELLVRSGPFRWRIPVAEIREVKPTRNPLSSPALSLDRLEIRYGSGGFLLIARGQGAVLPQPGPAGPPPGDPWGKRRPSPSLRPRMQEVSRQPAEWLSGGSAGSPVW